MNGAGINAWAGLGLFFVGLRMISAHMRHFAGGGLRALLSRTLGKTAAPECAGVALGALTQSTAAVTFITSGLLASRTLPMPRALRMVSWANVGTSALVLLAAIHIHSMVLVLLGLVGFGFFMGTEQSDKYRHATYALLGLGLLLFGLTMLKDSVGVLENEPWMREFVAFAGSGILVALVSSFVVAVAVQSSSIVTVLALPLVSQDLIGLDQALLMIYGASVGSGFALLLASSGMDGDASGPARLDCMRIAGGVFHRTRRRRTAGPRTAAVRVRYDLHPVCPGLFAVSGGFGCDWHDTRPVASVICVANCTTLPRGGHHEAPIHLRRSQERPGYRHGVDRTGIQPPCDTFAGFSGRSACGGRAAALGRSVEAAGCGQRVHCRRAGPVSE